MIRKGCDTGFFRALLNGHPTAVTFWRDAARGQCELVVSTASINELLTLYYRYGQTTVGRRFVSRLLHASWVQFTPVSVEITEQSAGYRHGLGLPTVDSMILATAVRKGCDELLTTDSHFLIAMTQGVIAVTILS
ncbi:MAG: type II toxin-antitoxin system VapC family toxin [Abditibacteriales bacterium]|nr:type II toxin-antitoxin system VapC family toxin [Abditibacteriales bacterium]MDW8364252.1 type II toxin-antitoxin system VapC family toxin [Abditibacteriales bacterium]